MAEGDAQAESEAPVEGEADKAPADAEMKNEDGTPVTSNP
jgi:hypothetical protein